MNKTTEALLHIQAILDDADVKDRKVLESFLAVLNHLPAHVRDRTAEWHIKQIRANIERRLESIPS